MSRRNKTYSPSEHEAEFALAVIFGGIVAVVGTLFGLITFGLSRFIPIEPKDLLAPDEKGIGLEDLKNVFQSFMELAIWEKIACFVVFGGVFSAILDIFSLTNPSVRSEDILLRLFLKSFFTLPTFYLLHRLRLFEDEKPSYRTLFYDGKTPRFDKEFMDSVYVIRLPHGMEWNSERSIRCVEQLLYSFAPLLFRISADEGSISWQVIDLHGRDPEMIEHAIRTSYPEADVRRQPFSELEPLSQAPMYRLTLVYRSASPFVFPMKYASEIKDFDPLTSLVSSMNGLLQGERMSTNLFVVGAVTDAQASAKRLLRRSTIRPSDYLSLNGFRTIARLKSLGLDTVEQYVPRDQKVLEEKLRNPLYQAVYMTQIDSPDKDRLMALARNMDSQMYGFSHEPYNSFSWYTGIPDGFPWRYLHRTPPDPESLIVELTNTDTQFTEGAIERIWSYAQKNDDMYARKATRLILGGDELALLWHVPDERFTASRIQWLSSRTVPPPTAVIYQKDSKSVMLGYGTGGGKLFPIALPLKDRENHVRIVGKTGVGKSTFMYDLIMQDIRSGYGVAVVDPHGSLVQNILETKMPPEDLMRIVVLDLSDTITPPPLNPLRGGLGYVRVGQIVQSIERIYPTTRQYPRLSYFLRTALLTLNADPSATMKDVVRLFTDQAYRDHLIIQLQDAELRGAWEEFNAMKDGEKRTITEPIRTRMAPFYSNPDLTALMCHPDSLDFRQMIQEHKIILVSLKMDEERVPQTERDLIGALLISRLQMSGMHTQGNTPYFVYIDEVQRFVTSSLDEMFAEARKFGLSLTVAHQFLDQLPDTTQNAIIGNAGASIIFGCSPKDAQVFQPFTRPYFEVDDIVNLDQFTAVVKMQCDGVSQPAFTLLTPLPKFHDAAELSKMPLVVHRRLELDKSLLPHLKTQSKSQRRENASSIRTLSRALYTPRKREEVHAWLRERYGRTIKLDDQTQFFDGDTSEASASTGEMYEEITISSPPEAKITPPTRNSDVPFMHLGGGGTVTADKEG